MKKYNDFVGNVFQSLPKSFNELKIIVNYIPGSNLHFVFDISYDILTDSSKRYANGTYKNVTGNSCCLIEVSKTQIRVEDCVANGNNYTEEVQYTVYYR